MVDVTSRVQNTVGQAKVDDGYVICYVPHTTAGITIQENADPNVTRDLLWKLEQLVPEGDRAYRHTEGNSDAHIKASLMGFSQLILIRGGRLVLGTWQAVYLAEFDGPRTRRVNVKIVPA